MHTGNQEIYNPEYSIKRVRWRSQESGKEYKEKLDDWRMKTVGF